MATPTTAKRTFIEIVFWWVNLLIIAILASFLKYPHVGLAQRILMSAKGVTLAAIVIMLLNRVLQRVLSGLQ